MFNLPKPPYRITKDNLIIILSAIVIGLVLFTTCRRNPVIPDSNISTQIIKVENIKIIKDSVATKKILDSMKKREIIFINTANSYKRDLSVAQATVKELLDGSEPYVNDSGDNKDSLRAYIQLLSDENANKDVLCNSAILYQDSIIANVTAAGVIKDSLNSSLRTSIRVISAAALNKDADIAYWKKSYKSEKRKKVGFKLATGGAILALIIQSFVK